MSFRFCFIHGKCIPSLSLSLDGEDLTSKQKETAKVYPWLAIFCLFGDPQSRCFLFINHEWLCFGFLFSEMLSFLIPSILLISSCYWILTFSFMVMVLIQEHMMTDKVYSKFNCQYIIPSRKQLSMKFLSTSVTSFLFVIVILFPLVIGDLSSDKQALLDFANAIPHRRNLMWNPSTSVCESWVGITCNENRTRVVNVRLPGVGLVGTIPSNILGKLDAVKIISLRSNLLSGNLPADIASLPSLQYLYLQHNNLSGDIPASLSPQLVVLDLSYNSFSGGIPETFQNFSELTSLNLQNNSLSGQIPNLNVTQLRLLNLSYNHLNGSIPKALHIFPNSSFEGNSLLCGPPLKPCSGVPPTPSPALTPPPSSTPGRQNSKYKLSKIAIIAIGVGGAVVLFFIALVIVICCLKNDGRGSNVIKGKGSSGGRGEKPKEQFGSGVQEPEKNKLVFFEGSSYNFDLEDLLRASAEVLGKGSYGTAYKAILEESMTVVVKRLKEVVVGKKDFEQQMDFIGRVGQHTNVVPLRAYYYSKDEKLLVYDYIPAGNLHTLLHGMHFFFLVSIKSSKIKLSFFHFFLSDDMLTTMHQIITQNRNNLLLKWSNFEIVLVKSQMHFNLQLSK